jgi:post-segregation antitoxin (ccd killing protein)
MTTTVQISLPDQLAQQARAAGILNDQAMERIIKMELKRRAGEQLLESVRKISAVDGAAPSAEEIQTEIDAYRAERRAKSG